MDSKVLNLLNQIIEMAKKDDEQNAIRAINEGKGERAVGESSVVFHLKVLKKLIKNGK